MFTSLLELFRALVRPAAERSREKLQQAGALCDTSPPPANFTEEELEDFYMYWDEE